MNFDIWGPSHGLAWVPYNFFLSPPSANANGCWTFELKLEYVWVAKDIPVNGPFGAKEHAWHDDFEFPYPMTLLPAASAALWSSVPRFYPVDLADPRYLAWLATPEGSDFDSGGFSNHWENVWCENDPADPDFTDGHIHLSLGYGIDLAPLFPMAFTLEWPDCPRLFPLRGPGWKPPIPGLARVLSTV